MRTGRPSYRARKSDRKRARKGVRQKGMQRNGRNTVINTARIDNGLLASTRTRNEYEKGERETSRERERLRETDKDRDSEDEEKSKTNE